MGMEAILNALRYTITGLTLFAVAAAILTRSAPKDQNEAIMRAAIVLGAAIIIAATMH